MSAIPSFTETHAALLRSFLSSPQRAKGTMTYPQLAGFLFSMANAPEMIPPSEWIPIVFNDQDARYKTRGEAEGVLQAMMALYNDCGRE
jgi:yecA family protein